MIDPWSYVRKGDSEYAHQVALFMWANMAAKFGEKAASFPESYMIEGFAKNRLAGNDDRLPQLDLLFAIKNAGHGDAVRGARSKAEGIKKGVPDIFLPVASFDKYANTYSGLFIELKRPKTENKLEGRASKEQCKWAEALEAQSYLVKLCYGWEAAKIVLLDYLR